FTVVLTHDIDSPRRWTSKRSVVAAGGRMRTAALDRNRGELLAEARGLAWLPIDLARERDPNWAFQRIHEIEEARGGRSTHFLMAGHHHPADGDAIAYDEVRARMVDRITTSDHPERLRGEQERLAALVPAPLRSARFHFLRHDPHRSLAELDALGFAL